MSPGCVEARIGAKTLNPSSNVAILLAFPTLSVPGSRWQNDYTSV